MRARHESATPFNRRSHQRADLFGSRVEPFRQSPPLRPVLFSQRENWTTREYCDFPDGRARAHEPRRLDRTQRILGIVGSFLKRARLCVAWCHKGALAQKLDIVEEGGEGWLDGGGPAYVGKADPPGEQDLGHRLDVLRPGPIQGNARGPRRRRPILGKAVQMTQ
jgi:hypothetical protein